MDELNVNLINDNSILFLFVRGMEDEKKLFDEAVESKKPKDAFIHFYHFLCDMFALREKCGYEDVAYVDVGNKVKKQQVKDDSLYGALKNIYESLKHKDVLAETFSMNLYISNKTYPHTYPYTYGKAYIRFTKVNENFVDSRGNRGNKDIVRNSVIERHQKYLEGKNVSEILGICINECSDLPNKIKVNSD